MKNTAAPNLMPEDLAWRDPSGRYWWSRKNFSWNVYWWHKTNSVEKWIAYLIDPARRHWILNKAALFPYRYWADSGSHGTGLQKSCIHSWWEELFVQSSILWKVWLVWVPNSKSNEWGLRPSIAEMNNDDHTKCHQCLDKKWFRFFVEQQRKAKHYRLVYDEDADKVSECEGHCFVFGSTFVEQSCFAVAYVWI